MRALLFSLLIAAAVRAENFAIVRESSGAVAVGTALQWSWADQVFTNGQYSIHKFASVSHVYTNSAGEEVQGCFPRSIFWDKSEPYVWDFTPSNIYRSASGFIVLDFRDSLP